MTIIRFHFIKKDNQLVLKSFPQKIQVLPYQKNKPKPQSFSGAFHMSQFLHQVFCRLKRIHILVWLLRILNLYEKKFLFHQIIKIAFEMNKITLKQELNIEYINLSKAETDSFRHSMIMKTSQLLTKDQPSKKIQYQPLQEDSPQQKSIFIKKQALQRTLSVYQWRYKTCYPILKPVKLVVKSFTGNLKQKRTLCKKNTQSPFQIWNLDENIYELLVTTEKINYRLSQLGHLSLPQLFYLLKQTLVGFECLIDIFGIFQPTEEMIAVNQNNQWRFWISEDLASNSKREADISETEFILKIVKMMESRLPSSKLGARFFQEVRNLPVRNLTFLNLLDMTNIFISLNKMIVAKKFVPTNLAARGSLTANNQNYFKMNRTFNDFKETPKSLNDNSFNKIQPISHFGQHHSAKHIAEFQKVNIIKSVNEKSSSGKVTGNQLLTRQSDQKKEKQHKPYMKISQFYSAQTLAANHIEKKKSFMLPFSQNQLVPKEQKEKQQQIISEKLNLFGNPVSTKKFILNFKSQTCPEAGYKTPCKFERKCSFQNILKTQPTHSNKPKASESQTFQLPPRRQRKNSYYNYEKPVNKEAFSQSPHKSNSKQIFLEQANRDKQIPKPKKPQRHQNLLMKDESLNRPRKYSQQVPRIMSLDEFAKKNKKMCESSTLDANQTNKQIKYSNLKSKDIACHNRYATNSGMVFGQTLKKNDNGFNNINNDLYNGKFMQIMASIKSKSNNDKDQIREDMTSVPSRSVKRRATLFDIVRQIPQGRQQLQASNQLAPKAEIRISNTNNQTAQTMNKSEMNIVKGSQQSNSLSNNNNHSNLQQSDINSNEKNYNINQSRRGVISQSNLSNFSCKTYQPSKQIAKKITQPQRVKQMTTSQDCFNFNYQNYSESSEDHLKSNQWNKKISGLFSDVASIKVLKQSSHFGEEFQFFEKDYLKNVKLQKLDKLGKQLKGSIIEYDDGHPALSAPNKTLNNKQFALIGEVKEEPYENDPSYLQYSTSVVYQSRHPQLNKFQLFDVEKNLRKCESFEQLEYEDEVINGGFNFTTELYNITQNR